MGFRPWELWAVGTRLMALRASWTAVLVASVTVRLEESWKTGQPSLGLVATAFQLREAAEVDLESGERFRRWSAEKWAFLGQAFGLRALGAWRRVEGTERTQGIVLIALTLGLLSSTTDAGGTWLLFIPAFEMRVFSGGGGTGPTWLDTPHTASPLRSPRTGVPT